MAPSLARWIACLLTIVVIAGGSLPAQGQSPTIEKDIPYLGGERTEKGDLYLPANRPAGAKSPAVLIIHGGGWVGGSRSAKRELNIGNTLAEHGMVGFSIDYKLGVKGNAMGAWPQNLHDCKTAVRWLRVNAEKYGIDPDRIGVIGGSAGGHLSSMVAVTDAKDGLDPKSPWGDVSCQVRCVVDLYGPIQVSADTSGVSAITKYLDKNDPPFLIMHGTKDTTVPLATSEKLSAAVKSAGIEQELVIIEGAPHTFDLQPKQKDLRPQVIDFFKKHLLK